MESQKVSWCCRGARSGDKWIVNFEDDKWIVNFEDGEPTLKMGFMALGKYPCPADEERVASAAGSSSSSSGNFFTPDTLPPAPLPGGNRT